MGHFTTLDDDTYKIGTNFDWTISSPLLLVYSRFFSLEI